MSLDRSKYKYSSGGKYRSPTKGKWEKNPWYIDPWRPYDGYFGLIIGIAFWIAMIWLIVVIVFKK
jgi:hypothetical protein